jgi:hypothetical protein
VHLEGELTEDQLNAAPGIPDVSFGIGEKLPAAGAFKIQVFVNDKSGILFP